MLVLSRKIGQQITIADNIVVTVLGIRGDRVRIGIKAPREIPVHRKEVFEAMQQAGRHEAIPASRHDAHSKPTRSVE